MHARQKAAEAELALEREKVKVAELEQQLKQLKDTLARSKQ
ncbi:MAG: hypothetical protein UHS47_12015 [Oscillospiraceae bacterium]|nr:hypothetical protein [Oscillospiraceae bacterium]